MYVCVCMRVILFYDWKYGLYIYEYIRINSILLIYDIKNFDTRNYRLILEFPTTLLEDG